MNMGKVSYKDFQAKVYSSLVRYKKEELKIEEKPSEEKVEKAKNITALLKKISEDDSAFNGVVELFSKIETLAQKHGSNYDYALKAINDRLRLKKKED